MRQDATVWGKGLNISPLQDTIFYPFDVATIFKTLFETKNLFEKAVIDC